MNIIFDGQVYLFLFAFIMIIAGIVKDNNLFGDFFGYFNKKLKSKKALVASVSALTGCLPIKGRVTLTAGLLDSMAPKGKGRQKLGVIDYLSTHHYYFWSPLEKTVILPMAAFGLTYSTWLGIIWPLLAVSIAFILAYLIWFVKEEEIQLEGIKDDIKVSRITRYVVPYVLGIAGVMAGIHFLWCFGLLTLYYMTVTTTFDYQKILKYIDWKLLGFIAIIIVMANIAQRDSHLIYEALKTSGLDITSTGGFLLISLMSFIGSFILGSSSRFAAITVLLVSIYGIAYLPWFFAVDFCGYILSPMHKCLAIGKGYFKTPLKYYLTTLITWCSIVVLTGGVLLYA